MELAATLPAVFGGACRSTARSASRSLAMAAPAENHNKPASRSSSSSPTPGIPKLEPFNRGRISRLVKEHSLLEKAEHAISDRCSVLEGDDAYECWEALFEFEDMKEKYTGQCNLAPKGERQMACWPLERLESFVRQSGGVASLINNVRALARANEMRKASTNVATQERAAVVMEASSQPKDSDKENEHFFPEAGNLPPSKEELEWEEGAMMPESSFTRVLKAVGIPSPWFAESSIWVTKLV